MPSPSPTATRPTWRSAVRPRSVVVALLLGTLAALALSPVYWTSLPVLLARALFLALVLLLVFAVAKTWATAAALPGWLPPWLVPVLAVALAAPVAAVIAYLPWVGGDLMQLARTPAMVNGVVILSGTALVLGLVLTLGSQVRERDAQAREQALQFALERSLLEKQALDARLSLLHAQIEPHFLFNTLANVQALVESGSPRATGVLKSLVDYLRAAVPRLNDGDATLGDELALVRAYLELMQMRMPDRLQFAVDVPAALLGRRFPAMGLLTLVENAVRHGIDPREEGGRIDVGACETADGGWRVWVADDGVGLPADAPAGTGLANLRARLPAFFGPTARLDLSEAAPHGVVATIAVGPAP